MVTFRPSVPPISLPSELIGEAAPMDVLGAITATLAAIVMNVPALAARDPDGATYTTTGTFEASMRCTMARTWSIEPAGCRAR